MAVKDTKLHTAYIVSNTRVGDGIYELVLVCDELARTKKTIQKETAGKDFTQICLIMRMSFTHKFIRSPYVRLGLCKNLGIAQGALSSYKDICCTAAKIVTKPW